MGVDKVGQEDVPTLAHALGEALDTRSLSLTDLQRKLRLRGTRVSLASLSYWRSGKRLPEGRSLESLTEIEEVLGLAPRALHDLIGPSRRRGAARRSSHFRELMADGEGVAEVLAALDLEQQYTVLFERSLQVACDVDRHRQISRQSVRALYESSIDGADRFPIVLTSQGEPHLADVTIESISGGRLGRSICLPGQGIFAYEVLLERPLRTRETVVVEHTLRLSYDSPECETSYEQYVFSSVRDAVVWVRFDPDEVPASCETYQHANAGDDVATRHHLRGGTSAHSAVRHFGPGAFGVRWVW